MATIPLARPTAQLLGNHSTLSLASSNGRASFSGSPRSESPALLEGGPSPIIASQSGISCSIVLAEPYVYLSGFEDRERDLLPNPHNTAMVRGKMILNITKSTKVKAVTLKFYGTAQTQWPEGIPPEKKDLEEKERLRYQVYPFFNAQYPEASTGYGTQCIYRLRNPSTGSSIVTLSGSQSGRQRSTTLLPTRDVKRLSLQTVSSLNRSKTDLASDANVQGKGYKMFHPGVYEYSFEIALSHTNPETIQMQFGSVRWWLEGLVERSGTFKSNLIGRKEVQIVRVLDNDCLETSEPISISRKWDEQLYYEIVVSGKAFPLGAKIPIAFKLTPLDKVQLNRIRVYVTEKVDYFCRDRKVTRRDNEKRILLFEKNAHQPLGESYEESQFRIISGGETTAEQRARQRELAKRRRAAVAAREGTTAEPLPAPSANMLGDLDLGLEHLITQTEIEIDARLPTCAEMLQDERKRIHPKSSWKNIQVYHWIKIVLRLTRWYQDEGSTEKRLRQFEISIDSPFTVLSCLAKQQLNELPLYDDPVHHSAQRPGTCGCPDAGIDTTTTGFNGSIPSVESWGEAFDINGTANLQPLAQPAQAHVHTSTPAVARPIHFLRRPSFNPPAFDADTAPPQLQTPPPSYESTVGTPSRNPLVDYFARLADAYSDDDTTDDEGLARSTSRSGRVNVPNPRTPGGRGPSRSMEINREFMFRPEAVDRMQNAVAASSQEPLAEVGPLDETVPTSPASSIELEHVEVVRPRNETAPTTRPPRRESEMSRAAGVGFPRW